MSAIRPWAVLTGPEEASTMHVSPLPGGSQPPVLFSARSCQDGRPRCRSQRASTSSVHLNGDGSGRFEYHVGPKDGWMSVGFCEYTKAHRRENCRNFMTNQDAELTARAEAEVLKQLRAMSHVTQNTVCDRIHDLYGIIPDRSELSRLETAKLRLSPQWREQLCRVYGLDVQDFEERVSRQLTILSERLRIEVHNGTRNDEERPNPALLAPRLPVPFTSFIGREQEIAEIKRLLRLPDTYLMTLTGAGGIGKTRVAIKVADELATEFSDGVCFVDFAGRTQADLLKDPDLIARAVAPSLGVREETGRSIEETLCADLRSRSLLMVWDNCDYLVNACKALAVALRGC